MGSRAQVTVAVVSWNTRDLLARCLGALEADVSSGLAEVVVVDNGSSDGSRELVSRDYAWATLIEPAENLGFGAAVNLALAGRTAPWVIAANADIEPAPGAIAALLTACERTGEPAAAAPRLITPGGSTQHSVHRFPTATLSVLQLSGLPRLWPGLGERLLLEGYWDPERAREVDWAHGAFLLVRRDAFEAVGGFDDRQWMYAEDIDIAWRLRRAGHRIVYVPGARVAHAVAASTRQAFGGERRARYMDATYDWIIRRRGRSFAAAFALAGLAGVGARLAALRVRAAFAGARPGRRAELSAYRDRHREGLRRALTGRKP